MIVFLLFYIYFFNSVKVENTETNVCSMLSMISHERGIVQGNFAPNLSCDKVLTLSSGKSINLWFLDMKLGDRDSNGNCQGDFLKIIDSTGEYIHCGSEKAVYHNKFCSNTIYISYRTGSKVLFILKNLPYFKNCKIFLLILD